MSEIKDPIHIFVPFSEDERRIVGSVPFQRLRHVHQLALTYLVYPGATHRRFEHSLGVMKLASDVYNTITEDPSDVLRKHVPDINRKGFRERWGLILRLAALCHDIGHLPFSHAAEERLLPGDTTHEDMTWKLIHSDSMRELWDGFEIFNVSAVEIAKVAVGQEDAPDGTEFTVWEEILSDIIVGDAFGVDRMDYLLRDAHHAGVEYGRFDHSRLINTMEVIPDPETDSPSLGILEGGIHAAEALLVARYFMFSTVYLHPVRRIYDIHLADFLEEHLDGGVFPTEPEEHLALTDSEIMSAISEAARGPSRPGHEHASRIVHRNHFRKLYKLKPSDHVPGQNTVKAFSDKVSKKFGKENVKYDDYSKGGGGIHFPVKLDTGEVKDSLSLSSTLSRVQSANTDFIFVNPEYKEEAKSWFSENIL